MGPSKSSTAKTLQLGTVDKTHSKISESSKSGKVSRKKKRPSVRWDEQLREVPDPFPGTCRWIFNETKYDNWRSSPGGSVLFIEGPTGYGKSVLTKSIINELQEDRSSAFVVTYFFCQDQNGRNTAASILEAVLAQMEASSPSAQHPVSMSKLPTLPSGKCEDIWSCFTRARAHISRTLVVVVDGIDQCFRHGHGSIEKSQENNRFVKDLHRLCTFANMNVAKSLFIATSTTMLRENFGKRYPWITMQERHVIGDVEIVVNDKVHGFISKRGLPDAFADDITKKVMNLSGGHFEMAMAMTDALYEDKWGSWDSIMAILDKSRPEKLESIYSEVLGLIPSDDIKLATPALRLLIFAKRAFSVKEIEHAMAMTAPTDGIVDFEKKDPPLCREGSIACFLLCPSGVDRCWSPNSEPGLESLPEKSERPRKV